MVAGAVAVLRSSNLMPDASIDDIVRYLGATRLDDAGQVENRAEVGFSCDPNNRKPQGQDIFPGGPGSDWNEHQSLNCNNDDPVPVPYESPYTKVVIDLGAATELAAQDRPPKIEIGTKSGGKVRSINTQSKGLINVAVLGSETFDVATIDTGSLVFGPKGAGTATPKHKDGGHLEDVNTDAWPDLVSHYSPRDSNLVSVDTEACVSGQTVGGKFFEACDSVVVK